MCLCKILRLMKIVLWRGNEKLQPYCSSASPSTAHGAHFGLPLTMESSGSLLYNGFSRAKGSLPQRLHLRMYVPNPAV